MHATGLSEQLNGRGASGRATRAARYVGAKLEAINDGTAVPTIFSTMRSQRSTTVRL